ncbi:MAG: AAA family ATPase [Solirubrobacteraceae bacterium]
MSPADQNVFEQNRPSGSLNGATANQPQPTDDQPANQPSGDKTPTPPAAALPVNGNAPGQTATAAPPAAQPTSEDAARVRLRLPRLPNRPAVSRGRTPVAPLDPGLLLLPDEVYPDGGVRGRVAVSVRRLLQSESERREAAVDHRLAQLSATGTPAGRLVVCASPKGGSGKTTIALALAQTLATLHWPTLVVDLDLTGGTAALHTNQPRRPVGTVIDAINAIDMGSVRGPADLARFLTPLGAGANLLAAPAERADREQVDAGQVERLVGELARFWPVLIVDTSPGLGDRDGVQRWILEHASDIIAVAVPRRVDSVQARAAVGELCALLPDVAITVALNQVPPRPDEATRRVMSVPLTADRSAHRVEIPHDRRLARQLDRAALALDRLARPTRLGFKELAGALASGWL